MQRSSQNSVGMVSGVPHPCIGITAGFHWWKNQRRRQTADVFPHGSHHSGSFPPAKYTADYAMEMHDILVGGMEPWNFMNFHILGIIPTDFHIFHRGRLKPPTSI